MFARELNYFFGFLVTFEVALFAEDLTCFIGASQQISSQASSHPQGSSPHYKTTFFTLVLFTFLLYQKNHLPKTAK